MKKSSVYFLIFGIALLSIFLIMFVGQARHKVIMIDKISSITDIHLLFDLSSNQINNMVQPLIDRIKSELKAIIELNEPRTWENTIVAYDRMMMHLMIAGAALETLVYLSPHKEIREAAHNAVIKLQEFSIDNISQNVELYHAIKAYAEKVTEKLSEEQSYYLRELLKGFQQLGLDLPEDQREKVKALKKELAHLALDFDKAINEDSSQLTVTRDQLEGVSERFIEGLKKTDDGLYILGMDYPTVNTIMEECTVEQTRKQISQLFSNRAYPGNVRLLEVIIEKRDQLAHLLGYSSYAAYDIDDQMAQTVSRVQQFLDDLLPKAQKKALQEFDFIKTHLPQSVSLTSEGKIDPWNRAFVKNYIKKNYFNIDQQKISEYFPLEHTLQGLLDIYQQFLGLRFTQQPINLWTDNLTLIEVYRQSDNELIGYIILDLYPRPNKYSHACHIGVIPGVIGNGPEVSVVVANFSPSTATQPSLLHLDREVKTFFHEFGHAMHSVLGRTPLATTAGTHVKTDFVELPSQMLEEWLWDKNIVKNLSSHYQTGEHIADQLLDRYLDLKHFSTGDATSQQIVYARMSLDYFKEGAKKDTTGLMHHLQATLLPYVNTDLNNHWQASFGHLTGYGSKYYSYLWSKVFALDMFDYINRHGLLNPDVGARYIKEVIGKGGSQDPNILLKNFLGREPNQEAFLRDLGL